MGLPLRKFTVRTLDRDGLRKAALELATLSQGFAPKLVIGIRSGGYTVAELMMPALPEAKLLSVTCRRPSTEKKQKSSLIKNVIRKLPRSINDQLRIAEHIALTQLRPPKQSALTLDAGELAAVVKAGADRILIVDDAVDSGTTLAAVHDAVKLAAPKAQIRCAVITVTTDAPMLMPDFMLYRYVLCRFPWSLDGKN